MTSTLVGGLRDRMIVTSFWNMLHDSLDALGWLDPTGREHEPIRMIAGPVPRDEKVEPNTIVVTFEQIDNAAIEIGSNASELTHVTIVDFYAEPGPPEGNGGEALGKHVIGDIRSIMVGELPAIGRDWPVLDVYDYRFATPTVAFSVEISPEKVVTAKVRNAMHPWQRWWYTCEVELVEERT